MTARTAEDVRLRPVPGDRYNFNEHGTWYTEVVTVDGDSVTFRTVSPDGFVARGFMPMSVWVFGNDDRYVAGVSDAV